MPRAILIMDDEPDGRVSLTCTFEGGYQKTSHAHGQVAKFVQDVDASAAEKFAEHAAAEPREGVVEVV